MVSKDTSDARPMGKARDDGGEELKRLREAVGAMVEREAIMRERAEELEAKVARLRDVLMFVWKKLMEDERW